MHTHHISSHSEMFDEVLAKKTLNGNDSMVRAANALHF